MEERRDFFAPLAPLLTGFSAALTGETRSGPEKSVPPKGRSSAALRAGADFGAARVIEAVRQR